jgi:NitT/TauT family transport system substrate-binding protein
MADAMPLVKIAPNNPVFDLPVLVGIQEGLFAKHGLNVQMSAPYEAREKDTADRPIMARLKENLFDCGSADSYNVCEWASIDRLERGTRGGNLAGLRSAVAAQAIVTFEEALQVPRDMADVPVVVQELTGSHYTTIQMLESAVGAEHVKIVNGGLPYTRWEGLKNGTYRVVTVMEPFISLALKEGAHARTAQGLLRCRERGGGYDQPGFLQIRPPCRGIRQGRVAAERIAEGVRALQACRLLRRRFVRPDL